MYLDEEIPGVRGEKIQQKCELTSQSIEWLNVESNKEKKMVLLVLWMGSLGSGSS